MFRNSAPQAGYRNSVPTQGYANPNRMSGFQQQPMPQSMPNMQAIQHQQMILQREAAQRAAAEQQQMQLNAPKFVSRLSNRPPPSDGNKLFELPPVVPGKGEEYPKPLNPDFETDIRGVYPAEFNQDRFEEARDAIKAQDWLPAIFSRGLGPLRSETEYEDEEKVTSGSALIHLTPENYVNIKYVAISGEELKKKMVEAIVACPNIEVLILRDCGLQGLPVGRWFNVRYVDVTSNRITNARMLSLLLQNCPIEFLDIRNNPIQATPQFVRICPTLRFLNGQTTTMMDRVEGPIGVWDKCVMTLPEIAKMKFWQPALIQKIEIKNAGLTQFHVRNFASLKHLDLSGNYLTTVQGCGLEHLDLLTSVVLVGNRLATLDFIAVFSFCPSLKEVDLRNNPVSNQAYLPQLLMSTGHLPGTNDLPGLQKVDGNVITHADYMRAIHMAQIAKEDKWIKIWNMAMIQAVGHRQLLDTSFMAGLKSVVIRDMRVPYADVTNMASIVYLDLHGNSLAYVKGLESLTALEYLDLQNNKIDFNYLKTQMEHLQALVSLNLVADEQQKKDPQYRKSIVAANLPRLAFLDGMKIAPIERDLTDASDEFKLRLACFYGLDGAFNFDPEYEESQFEDEEVRSINCYGLQLENIDLAPYVNLRIANLANNKLTTLPDIPQTVQRLDLSHNQINIETIGIPTVVDYIMGLPDLTAIALRFNHGFNEQVRGIIVQNLPMHVQSFKLMYVDNMISVDERVQLFMRNNGNSRDLEEFKFSCLVQQRLEDTVLDLTGCNLKYVNFTEYAELTELYLAGNSLKTLRNSSITNLQNLEILDLRSNLLRKDEIITIVNALPNLKVLGVHGHKWMTKQSDRASFISELQTLRNPWTPLGELDGSPIRWNEVYEVLGETREIYKFHAILRTLVERSGLSRNDIVNLRKMSLAKVNLKRIDFQYFKSMESLTIMGNQITDEAILNANIEKCENLKVLDLSHNAIKNPETFSKIVDLVPSLQSIIVAGNPGADRKKIIGCSERMLSIDCKLSRVDNKPITQRERLTALEDHSGRQEAVNKLHFLILCKHQGYNETTTSITLRNQKIRSIAGIERFPMLQSLDVSNNKIYNVPQTIVECRDLVFLSIANNNIIEPMQNFRVLAYCHNLQELRVKNCAEDAFQKPEDYIESMGLFLRGLNIIDGFRNPYAIDKHEFLAVEYLQHFEGVECGRNNITSIDLNKDCIEPLHFVACLRALSHLPVKHLIFADSWNSIDSVRFMLLYMCKSLQTLNGKTVTDDERMNAIAVSSRLKTDCGLSFLERPPLLTEADYEYLDEDQIKARKDAIELEDFEMFEAPEYADILTIPQARADGSVLTKWEIFTTFYQIFFLLAALGPTLIWPGVPDVFNTILKAVSIDFSDIVSGSELINYAKYFGVLLGILFFYFFYLTNPKQQKWHKRYYHRFCSHICFTLFLFLICVLIGGVFAYVADTELITKLQNADFSGEGVDTLFQFLLPTFLAFLAYWMFAFYFHKKINTESFWFQFLKLKKRAALFWITTLYLPVIKTLLGAFKCVEQSGKYVIESFPTQNCGRAVDEYSVFQWVCLVGAGVTAFALPIFFSALIRRGVNDVDENYGIKKKLKDIKALRKKSKGKEGKKDVRQAEVDFRKLWSDAVREFSTAQSYLYSNYRRSYRYYKVIQMLEKFFLMVGTIFAFSTRGKTSIAFLVIAFYFLIALISRPFSDSSENVMDVIARLANFIAITLIASLSMSDEVKEALKLDKYITTMPTETQIGEWSVYCFLFATVIHILVGIRYVFQSRKQLRMLRKRYAELSKKTAFATQNTASKANISRQMSKFEQMQKSVSQSNLKTLARSSSKANVGKKPEESKPSETAHVEELQEVHQMSSAKEEERPPQSASSARHVRVVVE
ncbi:hypothetical protein PCE1_003707 [Barthelona sp. PCE]